MRRKFIEKLEQNQVGFYVHLLLLAREHTIGIKWVQYYCHPEIHYLYYR